MTTDETRAEIERAVSMGATGGHVYDRWVSPLLAERDEALKRHAYELKIRADVEAILDGELGTESTPETENGYVANVQLVVDRLSQALAERDEALTVLRFAEKQNTILRAERDEADRDLDEVRTKLSESEESRLRWAEEAAEMTGQRDTAIAQRDAAREVGDASLRQITANGSHYRADGHWTGLNLAEVIEYQEDDLARWRQMSARWYVLPNGFVLHSRAPGHLEASIHSAEELAKSPYVRGVAAQPAGPADQTIPSSPALRARVQTDEWCHADPAEPPSEDRATVAAALRDASDSHKTASGLTWSQHMAEHLLSSYHVTAKQGDDRDA